MVAIINRADIEEEFLAHVTDIAYWFRVPECSL
jgi:hypothetical protein